MTDQLTDRMRNIVGHIIEGESYGGFTVMKIIDYCAMYDRVHATYHLSVQQPDGTKKEIPAMHMVMIKSAVRTLIYIPDIDSVLLVANKRPGFAFLPDADRKLLGLDITAESYELPGGAVKDGESYAEAAKRETCEEAFGHFEEGAEIQGLFLFQLFKAYMPIPSTITEINAVFLAAVKIPDIKDRYITDPEGEITKPMVLSMDKVMELMDKPDSNIFTATECAVLERFFRLRHKIMAEHNIPIGTPESSPS